MTYVDGYVLPIPEDKLDTYKEMANIAGKVWMEHGALAYKECVADDLNAEWMKRKFTDAADVKPGETVIFAFVIFKSREHRDEVNAKVFADSRIKCDENNIPFDMNRMAYGGFKTLVDL